ncbi:hypothetical protein [Sphingopyxis terrae]|uniref:hypothetical protein n=1 Tax=Sphingopyxis terrae TaxID=33052 RepID=UPI002A130043|nr:hypothetical protein [Sphingopyxis terrae]MDX8356867.1 hypothetical protein [Sphingopyxis terrae]
MLSKSVLSALVFCTMTWATLTACEGANGADAYPAQRRTAALAENPPRAEGSVSASELDRNALEMAERACANRDFQQLFTAIAISPAVRRKYSAPTITSAVLDPQGRVISSRDVPANSYEDFPVRQVDFYYKPAKPRAPGDEDEYLDIQFNQSQSDDFSVDWARVHYDGQSEGGDDLGNIIGPEGKPLPPGTHPDSDGQLLFRPIGNCWQLQEDIRWLR